MCTSVVVKTDIFEVLNLKNSFKREEILYFLKPQHERYAVPIYFMKGIVFTGAVSIFKEVELKHVVGKQDMT